MPSPLENLAASGQLHPEPVDRREYEGLVLSGRVRLADAENGNLSIESRFDLAKAHQKRNDARVRGFRGRRGAIGGGFDRGRSRCGTGAQGAPRDRHTASAARGQPSSLWLIAPGRVRRTSDMRQKVCATIPRLFETAERMGSKISFPLDHAGITRVPPHPRLRAVPQMRLGGPSWIGATARSRCGREGLRLPPLRANEAGRGALAAG